MSGLFQSLFGGSNSKQQNQGSSTSNPVNMQNAAFTGLAPGVASGISNFFNPNSGGTPGSAFGISPFMVNGVGSGSSSNPLVAGLTPQQNSFLTGIGGFGQTNFGLGGPESTINRFLNPNYPASLATSPQTSAAVSAATQPLINAFRTTTMPGIAGQFTAAGQRTNANGQDNGGMGSSAFGRNVNEAENTLEGNVGQVAGGIENAAYQTGLQEQQNAINQATALSTTNLNNMVTALQASALPQMIQQYGIQQGQQLYQQTIQSILAALGLGGQVAQPAIANVASSNFSGTGEAQGNLGAINAFGNMASGVSNLVKANPFGMFG